MRSNLSLRMVVTVISAAAICGSLLAEGSADSVRIRLKAGTNVVGAFPEIGKDKLVLQTAEGSRTVALSDILSLDFPSLKPTNASSPKLWLTLVDGAVLVGDGSKSALETISLEGKTLTFATGEGSKIGITYAAVDSIRFKAEDRSLEAQWNEIAHRKRTGDFIVLRKTHGTEAGLDGTEVSINKIGGGKADVILNESQIHVSLSKPEGIFFYHRKTDQSQSEPIGAVSLQDGSLLPITSLESHGGVFGVETPAGARLQFSAASLRRVVFRNTDLLDLTAESPVRQTQSDFLLTDHGLLERLTAPRLGKAKTGGKGERLFDSALTLAAKTEIEYDVPRGYKTFRATLGVPESGNGNVILRIVLDGKEVFAKPLDGSRLTPVDLALGEARRIRFIADYGQVEPEASGSAVVGEPQFVK